MSKMFSKLKTKTKSPLLLISKSPRRADLLKSAGYHFDSFSLETSEIIDENLNPFEQSRHLSCVKMDHFIEKVGLKYGSYVYALTCDTLVEFEGQTLGKPQNLEQAQKWLLSYSGKTQKVHTGCCLMRLDGLGKKIDWGVTSHIFFKSYGPQQVEGYLSAESDVLSKAGAYGVQDPSFDLIKKIEGSYTNIVGLPLESLSEKIKKDEEGA